MFTKSPTAVGVVVCVASIALTRAASGQGFFPGSRIHIAGGVGASLGDLDRDGIVDLVAASQDDSYLFLRGDGLGGFAQAVSQPLSNPFFSSQVARVRDFDSDGRADILVIGHHGSIVASEIHVRLAISNGGLGADVASTLPPSLLGTVGDESLERFDSDRCLDYAFIRSNAQEILLARGASNGSFSAPTTIYTSTSGTPWSLAAGDVDGDADLDLLVLVLAPQSVFRLTNDGYGNFAPAVTVATGLGAADIELFDVDEDSRPDIVFGVELPPYGVWFAKGLGAGAFAAPAQLVATSDRCEAILPSDIDADGHVDLVACNSIARSLGGGAYSAPVSYPTADTALLGVIDVDGDGHADLVLGGDGTATCLLGGGAGTLVASEAYYDGVHGAQLADFNGDGRLDAVGNVDSTGVSTSIGIQFGLPGGAFSPQQSFPVGSTFDEVAVGDLDLDGRPDVVTTGSDVRVLLGSVGGGLGSAAAFAAGPRPIDAIIGDVSGDGLPDVVVAEAGYYNGQFFQYGYKIRVLRGDGVGGLFAPASYTVDFGVAHPSLGDFDNDGRSDVITSTNSGLWIQFGTPSGVLSAPVIASPLAGLGLPSCVDFDADGNLDYVATSGLGGARLLYVLHGDGLGSFPTQQVLQTLGNADPAATADIDGNGRVDIVCGVDGGFELFLQDTSGAVDTSRAYSNTHPVYAPSELIVADIDGDGRIDVISAAPTLLVSRNIGPAPHVGVYCTAKVNSNGCLPSLTFNGSPSATQPSGFIASVVSLVNQKSGLFFYGLTGSTVAPFAAGLRCVAAPLRRTPASNSAGSMLPVSDCSGVISIDLNAFARGALGGSPDPALSVAGTHVHCQAWARDVGAPPNNVQLSPGLQYFIEP